MLAAPTMMLQRHLGAGIVAGIIAVAGVIGLGGGCVTHDLGSDDDGGSGGGGGDGDGGNPPSFDGALDYERSGGFINTRTSVHVDAAGKVTWMKTDGSTTTTTLPPATLSDLRHKVDQAEFPTLLPAYRCTCNDDIVHKIQVQLAGAPHMVIIDDSSDYPARLRPLIDTLSGMTQTTRGRE